MDWPILFIPTSKWWSMVMLALIVARPNVAYTLVSVFKGRDCLWCLLGYYSH